MKKEEKRSVGALTESYEDNVALLNQLLRTRYSFDMLTKKLELDSGELTLLQKTLYFRS